MQKLITAALILAAVIVRAADVTTQVALQYNKGGAIVQLNAQFATNVAGNATIDTITQVGTVETQFNFGSVVTPGIVYIQNLSTNNFIRAGSTQTVYAVRCLPGETALFRMDTTNLFLIASNAACNVRIAAVSQ